MLNSGDDLVNGIGTGLKDAVDSSPTASTINIIGNYYIKSNTVSITNQHVLQGEGDAILTYNSSNACSNAMLYVTSGVTIQHLNINDGICVSPSRDLILINSPINVYLHYNNLENGKNAISVQDNIGNVDIRFNHIYKNTGYGILRASGNSNGTVKAVANNIFGNLGSSQVNCNNKGEVNHNFWGAGLGLSEAISLCSFTTGKQLGAAVLEKSDSPGVNAEEITLSGTKKGYFNNNLWLDGTNGSELILANHGRSSYDLLPFFWLGMENITECSNFYDVFIPDNSTVSPSNVNIYIRYNF